MKSIATIFASLNLVGCAVSTIPMSEDPLVGRWATDFKMSQLGLSKTKAVFRADRTFEMSVSLAFITINDNGTYSVEGDKIEFAGTSQRTMGFRFEDSHLILTEGRDTFRLHRVGDAR